MRLEQQKQRTGLFRRVDYGPDTTLSAAAPLWLATRVRIRPRTRSDYQRYIKSITPSFGALKLSEIDIGLIRQYQIDRRSSAGAIVINKEIGTLLQIRRRADISDGLEDFYEPLPLPYWTPPRAITDSEEEKFLSALHSKSRWEWVYCYALLALHTGAGGCELRGLQIGDVNLAGARMVIRNESAKNKYRVRTVPLVDSALWAAKRLIEIDSEKGGVAPHHYLFPFRVGKGTYDPERPITVSAIKKPWGEARKLAGVSGFRPHDTRHQVNTKLYESGADDMTVMSIMGHQSRAMSEHYSSIREARKIEAMKAAFDDHPSQPAMRGAAR